MRINMSKKINRIFWRDGLEGGVIELFNDSTHVYSLTQMYLFVCTPEGWDKCLDRNHIDILSKQLTVWYKNNPAFNGRGIAIMATERLRSIFVRIPINNNPCSEVSLGENGNCVLPHADIPNIIEINWRDRMIGGIIDIHTDGGDTTYACITNDNVYMYPYLPTEFGSRRKPCTNHALLASLKTELKKWVKKNNIYCSDKDSSAVNAVARLKKILYNMGVSEPIEVSEHPPFTPSLAFTVYQKNPRTYTVGNDYPNDYHRYDVYTQMNSDYMSKFEITGIRVFGDMIQMSPNSSFYITKDNIQYEHSQGGHNASRDEMRFLLNGICKDFTAIKAEYHKLTRINDHVDSLDEMVLFRAKEWVESKLYDFTGHSIEFKQLEHDNTATYKTPEGAYEINLCEKFGTFITFVPKEGHENEMRLSKSGISSLLSQLNDWLTALSRHDNVKEAVYGATTVQRTIDIVTQIKLLLS